jgi:hypothetical protein
MRSPNGFKVVYVGATVVAALIVKQLREEKEEEEDDDDAAGMNAYMEPPADCTKLLFMGLRP